MRFAKRLLLLGLSSLLLVSTLFAVPVSAQENQNDEEGSGITIEEFYRTNDITFFGRDKAVEVECGGSGSTTLVGGDNVEKAFNFFVQKGLEPFQSAGIIGNLMQESKVDPTIHQGGAKLGPNPKAGVGFGIAQWTPAVRQQGLVQLANERGVEPNTLPVQLDYMWKEMTSVPPYDQTEAAMKATKDIEDAVLTFERIYERAGNPVLGQRLQYAKQALARYGDGAPSSGSGSTSGESGSECDGSSGSGGSGNGKWPLGGGGGDINVCYGKQPGYPLYNGNHYGLDIATPVGTPVLAVADGEVIADTPMGTNLGPAYAVINHDGFATGYAHMASVSVSKGDKVKQGDIIGRSGDANGPHLHFHVMPEGDFFVPDSTTGKPAPEKWAPEKFIKKPANVGRTGNAGAQDCFK